MERMTENEIKEFVIALFEKFGYQHVYAPDIVPDSEMSERECSADVLLLERPRAAEARINSTLPADAREVAVKQVQRLNSPELIANNEAFRRMLTEGIKGRYQVPRQVRGRLAINPEKNYYISGFTKAI